MTQFSILDHLEKQPHKQTFRIILPGLITSEELAGLTEVVCGQFRRGSEPLFFSWWLASQNPDADDCWAWSRFRTSVEVGFNGLPTEKYLESVENKPLSEPNEIGLWFWDRGDLSHFIQLLETGDRTVEVRKTFLDGMVDRSVKSIVHQKPLKIEWEPGEFLKMDHGGLGIHDEDGEVLILERIR